MIIFWWCFPPARPKELLKKEKGWLTDIGPRSWWHMKCAQHVARDPQIKKRWGYSGIPGGGHKRLKDPLKWLKVATTLKSPQLSPTFLHQGAALSWNQSVNRTLFPAMDYWRKLNGGITKTHIFTAKECANPTWSKVLRIPGNLTILFE